MLGGDHQSIASPGHSCHQPQAFTATLEEDQQPVCLSPTLSTTKPAAVMGVLPPPSMLLLWQLPALPVPRRALAWVKRLNWTMFYCWYIFDVLETCKIFCPKLDE